MRTIKTIPLHLREMIEEIREVALEVYGLDFFETIFEMVDYKQMNEIAAFGGFPTRYPHWRFGMEYEQLSKSNEYGLSKIYEMVINNDPAYAYLLEGNNLVDQKTVIAHVYAHVDFFKNNYYFSKTNRKMVDEMANHGARIRRYVDRQGIEKVEDFVDTCLSLDNLIDYYSPFIERRRNDDSDEHESQPEAREIPKFKAKDYMDDYINPEHYIEEQKERLEEEQKRLKHFPPEPEKDVMLFLLEHAPLEGWEADILSIIREEAYYFAPQGQTKIMNEGWACVAADTPIFSSRGLVSMREVVEADRIDVSDGAEQREVYDRNVIADHETVTIRTRRGLGLTGSNNHRVMLADGQTWCRLDELEEGDRIAVSGGAGLWPDEQVVLHWEPSRRVSLEDVASKADVSLSTVLRHRGGANIQQVAAVGGALEEYDSPRNQALPQGMNRRAEVRVPLRVDEPTASFLGLLIGDGHISRAKRHFGFTSGDTCQAERFAGLVQQLFDVRPVVKQDENRWRVLAHAEHVSDFLEEGLGLHSGPCASEKEVPDAILRSPKTVVAAFLQGLFDADGYAGKQGVILSTSSEKLGEQVQLLLLNFGILSRRREQSDGCWHVHVTGSSAEGFGEEIGFGLERKQAALDTYLDDRSWFKEESWTDEVISVEEGREDVYDISVRTTHRYAAGGLLNHNSFWHSKILTEKVLTDAEIIDFADINSKVMHAAKGQLNPYKLGVALYRDIEERWNKGKFGKEWDEVDDLERKDSWDKQLGLGRKKIFEVRKLYNDVTFIDEFLTEEFARENKMFTFGYNRKSGNWEIESRQFQEVKEKLLTQLTNFGQPFIYVKDGNFKNRGELLLHHKFDGTPLRFDYAQGVLEALHRVWKRPVNIETIVDDKGVLLSFDGEDHEDSSIEYEPI
jgi:stage V sporulation protein R